MKSAKEIANWVKKTHNTSPKFRDQLEEAITALLEQELKNVQPIYIEKGKASDDDEISLFSRWKETPEEQDDYHSGIIKHFRD